MYLFPGMTIDNLPAVHKDATRIILLLLHVLLDVHLLVGMLVQEHGDLLSSDSSLEGLPALLAGDHASHEVGEHNVQLAEQI